MNKAAFYVRTCVLVDKKWMNEWVSERVSEWIANKSMMLRKHSMAKRRRPFPAHVHPVSTRVIVSVITIPTLCKSIIEREPNDHFSFSTCRVRIRASRSLCCSVTSLLSLSLFTLHNYTLEEHTLAAECNQRSFFTSDFVSHPFSFSSSFISRCQIWISVTIHSLLGRFKERASTWLAVEDICLRLLPFSSLAIEMIKKSFL